MKPTAAVALIVMHAAGDVGAPTGLLCRPELAGPRFGGRIEDLRKLGCLIENEREPGKVTQRYWLRHVPDGLVDEAVAKLTAKNGAQAVLEARAAARSQPRPERVRGVPGSAHDIDAPCFCDGCVQRASGSGLADHELAAKIEPVTAVGRARRASNQLPLLGWAA